MIESARTTPSKTFHKILTPNALTSDSLPIVNSVQILRGVDIFFIISGFVMVYTTRTRQNNNKAHIETPAQNLPTALKFSLAFFYKRCIRIFPVFWVISLMLLPIFFLKPEWINSGSDIATSLFHSAFLIPHPSAPLIMVAWTLEFEMFFYIVFALTLWMGTGKQISLITIVFIGLSLAGFWIFSATDNAFIKLVTSTLLLEFCAGMILGYIYPRLKIHRTLCFALIAIGSIWLFYWSPQAFGRVFHYGISALFIVTGCLGLEHASLPATQIFKTGFLKLGDISYSLYLIHVPAMVAIGRAMKISGINPHLGGFFPYMWAVLSFIICIISAYILWRFVEKPSGRTLKSLAFNRKKI